MLCRDTERVYDSFMLVHSVGPKPDNMVEIYPKGYCK